MARVSAGSNEKKTMMAHSRLLAFQTRDALAQVEVAFVAQHPTLRAHRVWHATHWVTRSSGTRGLATRAPRSRCAHR
jgi:hypothetical protein